VVSKTRRFNLEMPLMANGEKKKNETGNPNASEEEGQESFSEPGSFEFLCFNA